MSMLAKSMPAAPQANGQWFEVTPGERFNFRVSSEEMAGVYAMFEVVAEPRNGAPCNPESEPGDSASD